MPRRKPAKPSRPAHRPATVSPETSRPAAKLPHERDESTDAMAGAPRKRIRQAHDDVERGMVDTDRGPVTDQTYQKLKK